jgi:superoxide dismutase, Fe-Mn family
MPYILPDLPYAKDALGEFMSAETLTFHHDKHHKAYVDRTNQLVAEKDIPEIPLSELIRAAKAKGETLLFNQSAQIWNHTFYWHCLAPPEGQRPTGRLAELIDEAYGSTDNLLAELKKEAVGHFSNGWAWLVLNGDRLQITSLHDADTPVAYEEMKPLLTLDVWEHAYYIDYRNVRADFAEKVLGNIVNWEFVAQNLDGNGVSRADQG